MGNGNEAKIFANGANSVMRKRARQLARHRVDPTGRTCPLGQENAPTDKIRTFEDLVVRQKAMALVRQIYLITNEGALKRDFGLKDQLRRAAVSFPTNIAEDFERSSRKEYLMFLNIAKGSAGEVRSLRRVAMDVGYSHDRHSRNCTRRGNNQP